MAAGKNGCWERYPCHPQNASNYGNSCSFDSETGREFFFFKAPGFPGRGAPAPRELPPGSRLQLRAHRVHPVMPEHRGPLSTSLTHLPACLPPSQVRVEGWHLGFQVGQGGLELLQGRLRLRNRLWKELGQQGTWTSM